MVCFLVAALSSAQVCVKNTIVNVVDSNRSLQISSLFCIQLTQHLFNILQPCKIKYVRVSISFSLLIYSAKNTGALFYDRLHEKSPHQVKGLQNRSKIPFVSDTQT